MSEFECDLVRDLLPIYMDGKVSKESKEIVADNGKVKINKKILSPEKKVVRAVLIYCFSLLAFAFLLSAVLIYGA